MADQDELVDIELEVKRETDKAYLVEVNGQEIWLPKSLLQKNSEDGTFTMPVWLAEDRGLV